jgi:hypothetical protein
MANTNSEFKEYPQGSNDQNDANNSGNNNVPPQSTSTPESGYSRRENDTVVINDPTPVIILFGSGASGKTMTLIRLTKYLIAKGYKILPDKTFCDARDTHYKHMCDDFLNIVNSTKAPGRNQVIDFMLVKVMDKYGRPICQLLEAPGEHYFDPKQPNKQFPTYINAISQAQNRRTWVFIVEKDWLNKTDRDNFAQKIMQLQEQHVKEIDKVIFTCHKADLHGAYTMGGKYNVRLFFNDIKNQYQGIFSRYLNRNPITRFFSKYNFDFVVFSSGLFTPDGEGGQNYVTSNENNPARLWKAILKCVKGGWL